MLVRSSNSSRRAVPLATVSNSWSWASCDIALLAIEKQRAGESMSFVCINVRRDTRMCLERKQECQVKVSLSCHYTSYEVK